MARSTGMDVSTGTRTMFLPSGESCAALSAILDALDWRSSPDRILTHAIRLADAQHLPWDEFLALFNCIEAQESHRACGQLPYSAGCGISGASNSSVASW
jgi:hypothetical protein